MNGRPLRIATAVACVAALAAPGSALAAKKHKNVRGSAAPVVTVVVPHDYDAGGNGIGAYTPPAGTRVNLFDPIQVAVGLGNNVLSQLGLPPLPTL
jgi:hypothetical protein